MHTWRAILAVAAIFVLSVLPGTATASNLFTLDENAVSEGHLIVDAAGNAHVAWTSEGAGVGVEPVRYCRIPPGGTCAPTTLPIPAATSISDSASAAFPVFGPGNTVYVVASRFARNDVVFWTSTDGGLSFDGGTERNFHSSKTEPTDVFLQGSTFLLGAYNPGLGFSTAEIGAEAGGAFSFASPGDGGVASSSMGLDGANPVIAYWNLSDPPYPLLFYRYKGTGLLTTEANWEGPFPVTNGYQPNLAGGPAGLFMVSQDYSGGAYPDAVNVRRYEGTGFGPPRTLAVDASTNLFAGGAIAQSPSGNRLAVAWPGRRGGDGAYVMRLFTSTDGGGNFAESHIAHIDGGYGLNQNAELAISDGGAGWVVFSDSTGLRIADFSPIAAAPVSPAPAPKTPTAKIPGVYKGKTRTIVTKAGDFLIVLRLPKSCLQSQQKFFVGVGKRKRRQLEKKLGGKIRFAKVVFIYDGKKLKVKKKKPFRYLVDPGPLAAGSVHRVKAKVTAILERGDQERKIKRVIEGTVKAC